MEDVMVPGVSTEALEKYGGLKPTQIKGDEDFAALDPGTKFIDPEGNRRVKPWTVKSDADFEAVPEGEQFIDPEGKTRQKPRYEGVSYTSNLLYNMAANDKERKKALEVSYPGKVKELKEGEYYVEDEGGVKRKPKGFLGSPGAFLGAQAAPVVGSIAGEIGGGLAGAVGGPAGIFGGAVAGGAAGGAAGQGFNDAILQIAGIYDRTAGEEATELGIAGAAGGIGTGVGRGVGAAWPAVKGTVAKYAPKIVGNFLGVDEAGLKTAIGMREKGVDLVPPSMWAKEAPHIHNLVEVLDPAFRTQRPLVQSAEKHYETTAGGILEGMGVKRESSILNPTTEVPTKEAGEKILLKVVEESTARDAQLAQTLAERKAAAVAGLPSDNSKLVSEWDAAQKAAKDLIDAGFQDIEQDVHKAAMISGAGHNGGDLWQMVGNKLQQVRQAIGARHTKWYQQADEAAGGALPNSEGLSNVATQFLKELPEGFENKYPSVVKQIRDLAGVENAKGEMVKEAVTPTFGQLHNLRSVLRNSVNWYDLPSDIKNGAFKFFASRVDEILHDPGASEQLKLAARLLDSTDKSYGESMRVFNAKEISAVMKGLEAGEPADPHLLFNAIAREGHTDLTAKIMDMIGPNLASGVKAADVRSMLDSSKGLLGNIEGKRFVSEVLDRYRSGMLNAIHGSQMGEKLLEQAKRIASLEGTIDINVRPGDTAMDIIGKARTAADAAKAAAKADPLKALQTAMEQVEKSHAAEVSRLNMERGKGPLGFLHNPNIGAMEAVDRILSNEDMILAAGGKFGEQSPEFNMLRQIYMQRVFEGSLNLSSKLKNISPEVQHIMMPGVTLDQAQLLAKEMDFLTETKAMSLGAGKSIMAQAAVEHPWSRVGGKLVTYIPKVLPGTDALGRYAMGKYFKMVTNLSNNLTFMRWVEKGLKGDEQARQMVKREVQRQMQIGGAIGAGAAESQFATPRQPQ